MAAAEVLAASNAAYGRGRLYFRPRNPTQFWVEGVRKANDLWPGDSNIHAPILAMFVFDAEPILLDPSTAFSDGNMQSRKHTTAGSGDRFFRHIDFEKVFHDGPIDTQTELGKEIRRARCAEVLTASPMHLGGRLQAVMCRSAAERAALLYRLGNEAREAWRNRIRVFTQPGIFFAHFGYVDTVDLDEEGLTLSLHPRRDGAPIETELEIRDPLQHTIFREGPLELTLSKRWSLGRLKRGVYVVSIKLEGHRAYEGSHLIEEIPF